MDEFGIALKKTPNISLRREELKGILLQSLDEGRVNTGALGNGFEGYLPAFPLSLKTLTNGRPFFVHMYHSLNPGLRAKL
jgi:hypothetical protein